MNMPSKDSRVAVYLIIGAVAAAFYAVSTISPNRSIFSGCLENPGIIAGVLDVVAVALTWIAAVLGYGILGAAASVGIFGAIVDPAVVFVGDLVRPQKASKDEHKIVRTTEYSGPVLSRGSVRRDRLRLALYSCLSNGYFIYTVFFILLCVSTFAVWVATKPMVCRPTADDGVPAFFTYVFVGLPFAAAISVVVAFIVHRTCTAARLLSVTSSCLLHNYKTFTDVFAAYAEEAYVRTQEDDCCISYKFRRGKSAVILRLHQTFMDFQYLNTQDTDEFVRIAFPVHRSRIPWRYIADCALMLLRDRKLGDS